MIVLQVLFQKQPVPPKSLSLQGDVWLQELMTIISKIEDTKSDKNQWHGHQVGAKFTEVCICEVPTPFSANSHYIVHFGIYGCYPDDSGKNLQESMHKIYSTVLSSLLISARLPAWPWATEDWAQGPSQWIFIWQKRRAVSPQVPVCTLNRGMEKRRVWAWNCESRIRGCGPKGQMEGAGALFPWII